MRILNNQPVNFKADPFDNPYIEEVKYQQLVIQGDKTQFQFGTEQDNASTNPLVNSTFSDDLSGWYEISNGGTSPFTYDYGTVLYKQQGDQRTAGSLRQDALVIGTQYEVKIKIIHSYLGYWEVYLGHTRVGQLTSGVHVVSGICTLTNQFRLQFVPTILPNPNQERRESRFITSIGSVDWVMCTPKTTVNHRFVVSDLDDNTVTDNFETITSYLTAPYAVASYAQFEMNTLTMELDWQSRGIANGCHRIGVADADINTNMQCGARNSEMFGSLTLSVSGDIILPQWVLTTTGTATFSTIKTKGIKLSGGATNPSQGDMKQTGLKSGTTYDFQLEITAVTGVPDVTVLFGTTSSATFTTVGTHTGQVVSNGTDLNLRVVSSGNETASIDYLRIEAIDADIEIDYYSNPFNLQTTHHRSFVVNANNTENVFGLNYETVNWTPRARLRGYVAPSNNAYNTEREHGETSYGKRQVYYYKRRKAQLMIIENEPEFMHDWLSLLGGHDHIMINNVEYFYDEDEYPSITWDYWRTLGSTQIPVSLKQALERKTIKGEVKMAQFIEDADGNGVEGGFMNGDTSGLLSTAEYSGAGTDIAMLLDPSDPTGTTVISAPTGTTSNELTPTGADPILPRTTETCDYC